MVGWLPLIGPGAGCWLAGCCDDSRLAESRRLWAEVDDARARGGALLEWDRNFKHSMVYIHTLNTQSPSYLWSICHLCLVQSVEPKTQSHHKCDISSK